MEDKLKLLQLLNATQSQDFRLKVLEALGMLVLCLHWQRGIIDSLIQTKDTLTANKNYIQNIFVTNEIPFLQKYQGLIGAFRGSLFGRINTLNDMVEKLLNAIIKEIEKSETSNVFH